MNFQIILAFFCIMIFSCFLLLATAAVNSHCCFALHSLLKLWLTHSQALPQQQDTRSGALSKAKQASFLHQRIPLDMEREKKKGKRKRVQVWERALCSLCLTLCLLSHTALEVLSHLRELQVRTERNLRSVSFSKSDWEYWKMIKNGRRGVFCWVISSER